MVIKVVAITLLVVAVVAVAVVFIARVAALNTSLPQWCRLDGGPYDGEWTLVRPDADEWVTEGRYGAVVYRRTGTETFRIVWGGDDAA